MTGVTPDLIKRALAGDEKLVRQLIDLFTPLIQAKVARALVRRRALAGNRDVGQEVEDFTQAVFAALFANRGRVLLQWDPERGKLDTFVRLVAEREVLSILRTRSRSPWTEEPIANESLDLQPGRELDPEVMAQSREFAASLLERLRARISDRGRELFELLLIDGRSVEDVGFLLNMTPDAVYAWRSRLGRLAREIAVELSSEKGG